MTLARDAAIALAGALFAVVLVATIGNAFRPVVPVCAEKQIHREASFTVERCVEWR